MPPAAPRRSPARAASARRPGSSERTRKSADAEHEHRRGEVGHRREPLRLRQEVLDPLLVVAVDEERYRRVRGDDPEECRPVAEEPPSDPGGDPVHAEESDGAEDEHLEDDRRWQGLHIRRPRDPHDRREHQRPQVPDLRRRQLEMTEEPALRREPDLVSALEPDPAVVRDREGEDDGGRDLRRCEGAEHRARALQEVVDRTARFAGRAQRDASDGHSSRRSGTRRRCARSPRAGASAPRSRRARARASRRRCAAAGRSAGRGPRRSSPGSR